MTLFDLLERDYFKSKTNLVFSKVMHHFLISWFLKVYLCYNSGDISSKFLKVYLCYNSGDISSYISVIIQGILVPNLTFGPFLTLNVRNGPNLFYLFTWRGASKWQSWSKEEMSALLVTQTISENRGLIDYFISVGALGSDTS